MGVLRVVRVSDGDTVVETAGDSDSDPTTRPIKDAGPHVLGERSGTIITMIMMIIIIIIATITLMNNNSYNNKRVPAFPHHLDAPEVAGAHLNTACILCICSPRLARACFARPLGMSASCPARATRPSGRLPNRSGSCKCTAVRCTMVAFGLSTLVPGCDLRFQVWGKDLQPPDQEPWRAPRRAPPEAPAALQAIRSILDKSRCW